MIHNAEIDGIDRADKTEEGSLDYTGCLTSLQINFSDRFRGLFEVRSFLTENGHQQFASIAL